MIKILSVLSKHGSRRSTRTVNYQKVKEATGFVV